MMWTVQPGYIYTGFQDFPLAVISTELLYKLTLFKYLMSQCLISMLIAK